MVPAEFTGYFTTAAAAARRPARTHKHPARRPARCLPLGQQPGYGRAHVREHVLLLFFKQRCAIASIETSRSG